MKTLVYTGVGSVQLEERPHPGDPAEGELLVRVRVCGVCGSDVTDWYMLPRAPLVLGHEPAGEVVAVGAGVTAFQVGDRVALHHHMPCLVCEVCRRGAYTNCPQFKQTRLYPAGMAEYVRVPREIVAGDVLKLPDHLPYEAGALIEPIACCVRALDRAHVQGGDSVVIIGAGFNGIVLGLLAPHWGADRVAILDRVPSRLARAEALGMSIFNVDTPDYQGQVRDWAGGSGAGVVIVTPSKTPVIQQGLALVAPGGTLMLYGPPAPEDNWLLDVNYTFFKEITVTSSYSASPYDTRRTLSLLANGVLDYRNLITHRFPLDQADQAWHMTKAAGDSLKIVVEMP
ncbi:MAG: alcohol dehydrogenase [Chloroflexi bacterium CFX4]|nr:alcohol dehydrogenase [Chloroflexi bacterium CFX4]MDL1923334.1 zinc-binding dehydrogenase [Chloroflexi bacterium CFX3]